MISVLCLFISVFIVFVIDSVQSQSKVLVFTATAGYRHDSIPTAIDILGRLGPDNKIDFTFTEDRNVFTDSSLAAYAGVMFVLTSENVLDDAGLAALERYVQHSAFIGVHSAGASCQNSTFYISNLGTIFDHHPEIQKVTFIVLDHDHPSTKHLPDRWPLTEEIYNFKTDPREKGASVLLTIDPSTYHDGGKKTAQGDPHPLAWYITRKNRGSVWYTALGHRAETWKDPAFQMHVMKGLQWALTGNQLQAIDKTSASLSDGPSSSNTVTDSSLQSSSIIVLPTSASDFDFVSQKSSTSKTAEAGSPNQTSAAGRTSYPYVCLRPLSKFAKAGLQNLWNP